MNQQLKDRLIREAGFHFRPGIENTVPGIDWNCGSYGYDQCVDRLIALVVKECIDVCANGWQGEFTAAGISQCVSDLREHFGVE